MPGESHRLENGSTLVKVGVTYDSSEARTRDLPPCSDRIQRHP